MNERRCLRIMLIGVSLIGIGLVLPARTPEWVRATLILTGSASALGGSYALFRLPRQYRSEDRPDRTDSG